MIDGIEVPEKGAYKGQPEGQDPNHEHPPLGKLMIAGSIWVFGDNSLGWRLPSLLTGLAALLLLYGLVRAAGGDAWLATIAAGVLAFDNLAFVHGRIATLDMMLVAFLLLGAWCWMRGWRWAAGAACGLAALVKLGGVFGIGALLLLEVGAVTWGWWRARTWKLRQLGPAVALALGFGVTWFFGLWILDIAFTPYTTPWEHIRFMLDYGLSISHGGGPANSESNPWQWLANEVQIPYLRVNEDVSSGGEVIQSRPLVYFRGAMSPVVIGAAPAAVAYSAWRAWSLRDRLSMWVLAWILALYVSFYPLAIFEHRTMYIFYFLPTIPAIAVATAQLLRQAGLPRLVGIGYAAGVAISFAVYFPFRRF